MQHDRSIKWKIFGSFLVFIGFVILILWLFQVFFLESFYVYIKEKSIKQAVKDINTYIYEGNDISNITNVFTDNTLCLSIYKDGYNYTLYNEEGQRCSVDTFSYEKNISNIQLLKEEAKKNNGIASMMLNTDTSTSEETPISPTENNLFSNTKLLYNLQDRFNVNKDKEKDSNTMTYLSVIIDDTNSLHVIAVSSILTPVNATIETIKIQFFIIAIILIFIALVLALYLSNKIAKPIIKINNSAHRLAEGTYDIQFHAEGYREIDELNATLNYAANELSKVESLRRELIANMSHDLRTPLTMISGYGEIMRDIPGENTAENVQIIIEEANRLTNLVNDMLDLSKLQAGVQQLEISVFNLTTQIQSIIRRYDKLLTTKDFIIDFHYDKEVYINADIIKLEQVIYNLINNAINYSGDKNNVLVKQTIINDSVKISIIDYGPGIEEEQLPYIWDRYYKVDKTHVRSKVGTGIGLSIVKSVLELHKAQYGVESKLGEGTCFWFILPLYNDKNDK